MAPSDSNSSRPQANPGDPRDAEGAVATGPADDGVVGAEADEHDTDKVGLVIDERYRILSLVGRGGMGSVYKAEHMGIGRTVAIKLLHPTLARVEEVSKRFEREALAVGRIGHPNCVDVTDFGKLDDGSLYLVMEYLEGRSVGDVLAAERRVAPLRALHIMRHVLRGLGHAHAAEIIHRDMKPENILLVQQDNDPDFAKILDFGIAKLVGSASDKDDSVKLTQAGVAFGTPIYMSPEQAVGNPVDGRADLYGASVVLYEMITGRPPFYSDDKLEVLSMHTTRDVPAMREVAPDLAMPPDIEALVRRGLAKRPSERFATAADFVAEIDAVLAHHGAGTSGDRVSRASAGRYSTAPVVYGGTPVAGYPAAPTGPGTPYPGMPALQPTGPAPVRRNRRLLLGGIGLAAVAAIVVVALVARGRNHDNTAESRAEARITDRAAAKLEAGDPEAAVELLEQHLDEISDDARAQLQLGHGYSALTRYHDAIRAYERALILAPDPGPDEVASVRSDLTVMMNGRNGEVALDACDILLTRFNDPDAEAHLIEMASNYRTMDVRIRARELADKHDDTSQVDRVESFGLDLVQGDGCNERHEAVARLRALDDKRAIPLLKKALYRTGRGKWRNKNINVCLVDDAKEAIKYLEALPDPEPAEPAEPPPKAPEH